MNLRSVVVAWLRVLLPLAALSILSTVFLLSRRPDPDAAIPYARVDAEARARDPRIIAPTYAGVTADGATLTLTAAAVTPVRKGAAGAAEQLQLDWQAPDGLSVHLDAPEAMIGPEAITLSGGVAIATSTGWTMTAPQIAAATDRSQLTAGSGVTADAPFGQITANAMVIRREAGETSADHLLNLSGGVRLVYHP